jgi:hypothetical protein
MKSSNNMGIIPEICLHVIMVGKNTCTHTHNHTHTDTRHKLKRKWWNNSNDFAYTSFHKLGPNIKLYTTKTHIKIERGQYGTRVRRGGGGGEQCKHGVQV